MKIRNGFVSNSSSSSFVVMGITIDGDSLYEKQEVRNCDCNVEGIITFKFCPSCGKKVMKTTEELKPEFEDYKIGKFDIEEIYDGGGEVNFIVKIPKTSCSVSDYDSLDMVVIPDNLNELKQEIKELLEPLNLWNEGSFGLWVFHSGG